MNCINLSMGRLSTVHLMTLDGGAACLDFVNSGYDLEKNVVTERLHSYKDLLILIRRLRLMDEIHITALENKASSDNKLAESILGEARNVRVILYELFSAMALQRTDTLDVGLLRSLNRLFKDALMFRQLEITTGELRFVHQFTPGDLMAPVWLVVLSAYDLLRQPDLHYIKQCQRCSWLFFDKTKNHRKKWCSMESCGSSQKASRYYRRKKSA